MILPQPYQEWLETALGGPLPEERHARCSNCVMLKGNLECPPGIKDYHPNCRCCTYVPRVHNFLIGQILRDDRAEGFAGRQLTTIRILKGVAVSALGFIVPQEHIQAYKKLNAMGRFGRDPRMKCPFMVLPGICGIWQHRNAVCAAWFCRYDRGAVGQKFWSEARDLLTLIEHVLAFHCARTLCFPDAPNDAETISSLNERLAGLDWGCIPQEQIADYFKKCAEIVDQIEDFEDVLDLANGMLDKHLEATRAAYAALSVDPLEGDPCFVVGKYHLLNRDEDGNLWLTGYSRTDPLLVPDNIEEILARFDGRPLSELGDDLNEELLRSLSDHRVLVIKSESEN